MQPAKKLFPLAVWMLRAALLVLVYMIFFVTLRSADPGNLNFYIAVAFVLCAVLVFVSGFMKQHGLTMIPAALLFLGSLYKIVMHYVYFTEHFVAIYTVMAAVSFFFITNGNRKK